jgi:hypothetical protein
MKRAIARACTGTLLLLALATSALGSTAYRLPPEVLTMAPGIHRLGTAHHSIFGIRVFAATLWITGPKWSPAKPHALDVQAARTIPPQRMIDKLIDEMRDQGSGSEMERSQWETQMMRMLPEMEHGDQLVVYCTDNQPTLMFFNGTRRGEIDDPKFCSALFQVWLHPATSYSELRRGLLQK